MALREGTITPVVNGHRYSFASIEMVIADYTLIGITSVSYSDELPGVEIFGHDSIRIGRCVGKRKLAASFEVLRYEWMFVLQKLGNSYGRVKVLMQVQYADTDQPVVTDTIEGWLSKVDSQNEEGTTPSSVKIDIDPMEILHGGQVSTPEGGIDGHGLDQFSTAEKDATFWQLHKMGIEGPVFPPNPWDTVSFGGDAKLPGVCKIKGLPMLAFDRKKAGGVDGATITVNGYLPGPIEVECMIWMPDQYKQLRSVVPLIWRKPNKKEKASELAKPLIHPAVEPLGIRQVVILGVSVLEDGPLPGTKVMKFKCNEVNDVKAVSRTKSTKKKVENVGLAEPLQPASSKNEAGQSPMTTDTGPGGPAKQLAPGS
jgi:hypothetical protein